jgi:hypothetical protein
VDHAVATIAPTCLNCGAALDGPYCAQCGQKAVPPKPAVHELLHDALEEFLHFDGKIVQTLRTLIARPGQLTVDVVAGRRARYIAPLRLYLTISVLYFLVAAASPTRNNIQIRTAPPGASGISTSFGAGRAMTDDEKQQLLEAADAGAVPRVLVPLVKRVVEDPVGLQRDVFAAWPKALFVLLPVFAVIVALFYHRRHFVEHLYFALHIHAFAFLAMMASPLAALTHVRWLAISVGVGVLIWIPTYVHLAFKRVYGETHLVTMLKETGVGFLYSIASIPAIFAAALWVASHPH